MGTRITPDDPVVGNPCSMFSNPPDTPSRIFAYFWELEQCPCGKLPPNMHVFTLFQDDVDACYFKNVIGASGWRVGLDFESAPPKTSLKLHDEIDQRYFISGLPGAALEHDVFNNDLLICDPDVGSIKGNALIFWLKTATDIINDLALPNDGNTFMEFFITDAHKPVYKFCNIRWSLNQKYLINP